MDTGSPTFVGAAEKKRERKMQKICFILFGLIITTGAFAADLCVRNDAMVVALNPDINGTRISYSDIGVRTWAVSFPYGTVSGIGACAADCTTPGCVATNQNLRPDVNAGSICYCKILRPVESPWVHITNVKCQKCGDLCGYFVAGYWSKRVDLIRAINSAD